MICFLIFFFVLLFYCFIVVTIQQIWNSFCLNQRNLFSDEFLLDCWLMGKSVVGMLLLVRYTIIIWDYLYVHCLYVACGFDGKHTHTIKSKSSIQTIHMNYENLVTLIIYTLLIDKIYLWDLYLFEQWFFFRGGDYPSLSKFFTGKPSHLHLYQI